MKPIKFPEVNVTFAENQPEYNPLPVFKDKEGVVVCCQKLSFKERLRVLFYGEIWLQLLTFNKPLTPHYMTTIKSEVIITKN